MTCIVLDMEWNQPVAREMTVVSGLKHLPVEIMQIGVVAVRDGKILKDTFESYVRPLYYTKIKGRIKGLTGINEKLLKNQPSFIPVMESFKKWCEKIKPDYIATWGYDDIPLLKEQSDFYEYDCSWLAPNFNLQPVFTRQYKIDRPQISLESAVEILKLNQPQEFHSAINDAMYTAMVLTHIKNPEERICWQRKAEKIKKKPLVTFYAISKSEKECSGMQTALKSPAVMRLVCPACGKPHSLSGRFVNPVKGKYLAVLKCPSHNIAVSVNFTRTRNRKYTWERIIAPADRSQETIYYTLRERLKNNKRSPEE